MLSQVVGLPLVLPLDCLLLVGEPFLTLGLSFAFHVTHLAAPRAQDANGPVGLSEPMPTRRPRCLLLAEEADAAPTCRAECPPADPASDPTDLASGQAAKDAKPGGSDGPARNGEGRFAVRASDSSLWPLSALAKHLQKSAPSCHCALPNEGRPTAGGAIGLPMQRPACGGADAGFRCASCVSMSPPLSRRLSIPPVDQG